MSSQGDTNHLEIFLGDFEVMDSDGNRASNVILVSKNPYITSLSKSAGLKLLQEACVTKAFKDGKELGLFGLFMMQQHLVLITKWTNKRLSSKSKVELNDNKFQTYLGLELAMSLVGYTS